MDGRRSADAVERFACPTCGAPSGSVCRTRAGAVAIGYHTTRFSLVPGLGQSAEVPVPPDRRSGGRWVPREPTAVRIGYSCAGTAAEAEARRAGLVAAGCAATFVDVVDATVRHRPELERALQASSAQRGCAEGQAVVLTVPELAHLARTGAELVEIAVALRAADVQLDVRGGPLAGVHHPHGPGSLLFEVLAAVADLDRADRHRRVRAGQRAAAERGRRGGRPPVIDDAMRAEAHRLRAEGLLVPAIAQRLVIATGPGAGRHPSVASVYRALAAEPPAPSGVRVPGAPAADATAGGLA